MEETTRKLGHGPAPARRDVLTALAAAAIVAGCKSTALSSTPVTNTASTPTTCTNDNQATAMVRDVLAFWLILITNPKFCPIELQPDGSCTVTLKYDKPTLLSYLSSLPQGDIIGTVDSKTGKGTDYIETVLKKIRTESNAQGLKYGAVLMAARDLFQFIGEMKGADGRAPYLPGEPCPPGIEDILGLASSQPISPVPFRPKP